MLRFTCSIETFQAAELLHGVIVRQWVSDKPGWQQSNTL